MDQLRQKLIDILDDESIPVYIKPPASKQMVYPCILIARDVGSTTFADNNPYRHQPRYTLTAIDEEPVSPLYKLLASLPRSKHNRTFTADNLNHDVFTIFFEEEE